MVKCGIYEIRSMIRPHRSYVGSASIISRRWNHHLWQLRKGRHHSIKLQRHFNVHGAADLVFAVLEECARDDLIINEQKYLDALRPYFNMAPSAGNQRGLRHSDKTKKKIGALKAGNDYWTGRKHSDAAKEKMRIAKLGRKLSIETRRKLSAAKIGNKNAEGNKTRLGKKLSDGSRRKVSEGLKRYFANKRGNNGHPDLFR